VKSALTKWLLKLMNETRGKPTTETVYFDFSGSQNTNRVLRIAKQIANTEGVQKIVLATTSGSTGLKAKQFFDANKEVIGVGSFRSRSNPRFMKEFERQGGKLVYAYDDVEYDYPHALQTKYRQLAGEGGKVCVEVVVVAVKAGFLEEDVRVIAIGGTLIGADTAMLIRSANDFPNLEIEFIICQPRVS
jgi:hypothetical protein